MEEKKTKVFIYIPSATAKIDAKAVESLTYLLSDCWGRKADGYDFFLKIGMQMTLLDARNEACKWAIENDMDYILWLDDDMIIPPDIWLFSQLEAYDKDIIAPLFFTRKGVKLPLIFKKRKVNDYYIVYDHIVNYKKGLQKVDAVGFGCLLMKTEILGKMQKPYFSYTENMGEDIYFCVKAKEAGFDIWCDTDIVIGHLCPPKPNSEAEYLAEKPLAIDFIKEKRKKDRIKANYYSKLYGDSARFDFIMPCYKNFEITKTAIESIYKNTDIKRFRFTAINDGNDTELDKYFKDLKKKYSNFDFITTEVAEGCVKGVNKALKQTKNEYVLITDNDILIDDSQWLKAMMSTFDDTTGIVVPVSNYAFGTQCTLFNTYFMRKGLIKHYAKVASGVFEIVKREVFKKVGYLDEDFGLGYNVDLDFSIRARKAGYNIRIARDVFIFHHGSKSLKQVTDLKELEKKTRKLLTDKWGKKEIKDLSSLDDNYFKKGENLWIEKK